MWEYGSRAGIWRLQRAFDDRGLKLTQWGVALVRANFRMRDHPYALHSSVQAYARNPEVTRQIALDGHELATHGYR